MVEWLQNPLAIIAIVIGAMFFGYFFGLFEGRGQGYKKRQKEEAGDMKAAAPAEPLPPASPPVPSDEIPVLSVGMAPDGGLRLKLDGQRVDTSALDAEKRKRLIAILTQMRPWLEAPRSVQSPQGASSSRGEQSLEPRPASPPKGVPTPSLSPKATPDPAPQPATPPLADDDDEAAPAPQSIVAQIDSVLQARLAGTSLERKGIRLQESPEGGVNVWVGVEKYGGIDEVPDTQIKTALRAAIAEWENKYTPGL